MPYSATAIQFRDTVYVQTNDYLMIIEQVAQLSQRDRAAGWVSYSQKRKTGTGKNIYGLYTSIFN